MASPRPRPSLGKGSLVRQPSYLDDHLEYKSVPSGPPTSIDGILEDPRQNAASSTSSVASPRSLTALPATSVHPTHQSGGTTHTLSHTNCTREQNSADRWVATLFYNAESPRRPQPHPDQIPSPNPFQASTIQPLPVANIPEGSAPTTKIADYPLEPPALHSDPEPLDYLYGAFISQLCLTHFLSMIDGLLSHNPAHQRRLQSSHRCLAPDPEKPRIMEITFSPGPNAQYLPPELFPKHESIYKFEREWNCEVILQPSTVFRRYKRLCIFDMDSTLIQQEVIDEIAAFIGVKEQVAAITERAMNGELDFSASLKARVALLKGVPADVFEQLQPKITITPGAKELCKVLKRLGFTLVVASGGFQPLADWLALQLGLDHAFANHLISDPTTQTLTGELDPNHPIVDPEHKRNLLISIAKEKGIPLAQTMAVGDGANDIPMLKTAGLGVAWRAKPKVQMEAPSRLNVAESMLDLVYPLGLTGDEVLQLLQG